MKRKFFIGSGVKMSFGGGVADMPFGRKSDFSMFRAILPPRLREIDPLGTRSCSTDPGLSFDGFYSLVAPVAAARHGFEGRAWGAGKCMGVCRGGFRAKIGVFDVSTRRAT